jgi:hypothetical protein
MPVFGGLRGRDSCEHLSVTHRRQPSTELPLLLYSPEKRALFTRGRDSEDGGRLCAAGSGFTIAAAGRAHPEVVASVQSSAPSYGGFGSEQSPGSARMVSVTGTGRGPTI